MVIALIRALPKALRTNFVPVPDWADAVLDRVPARRGSLPDAIGAELRRLTGTIVPRDAWHPDQVPEHLRMNFRVVDEHGAVLGEGRDLDALRRALAPKVAGDDLGRRRRPGTPRHHQERLRRAARAGSPRSAAGTR